MSCATLADAMHLGMRYHPTRMPYYDIQLQTYPSAPCRLDLGWTCTNVCM